MAFGDNIPTRVRELPGPLTVGTDGLFGRFKKAALVLLPEQDFASDSPAHQTSEFRTLYSTLAFVVVAASAVVFAYLFVGASQPGGGHFYRSILREDGPFEYIGASLFLLTALVLFFCGSLSAKIGYHGRRINKVLFVVAGLVLLVAAAEEISWGQRLFGVETPQYLKEINGQEETNFHNINKKLFDRAVTYGTVLLIVLSLVLHALRVERVFRLKIPSLLLVVSLCLVAGYKQYYQPFYKSGVGVFNFVYFPFNQDVIVTSIVFASLAVIIALSLLRRNEYGSWLTLFGAVFVVCFSLLLISVHVEMRGTVSNLFNQINEVREYLLAVCLFAYALELSSQLRREGRLIS